jgi:hypothetical protein
VNQSIGKDSVLVRYYDEALAFFQTKLKFELVVDTDLGNGQRFVSVSPPCSATEQKGAEVLVLSKADAEQLQYLGKQARSCVLLFYTVMIFGEIISICDRGGL